MPKKIVLIGYVVPNIGYGEEISIIARKGIPTIKKIIKDIINGKVFPSSIFID